MWKNVISECARHSDGCIYKSRWNAVQHYCVNTGHTHTHIVTEKVCAETTSIRLHYTPKAINFHNDELNKADNKFNWMNCYANYWSLFVTASPLALFLSLSLLLSPSLCFSLLFCPSLCFSLALKTLSRWNGFRRTHSGASKFWQASCGRVHVFSCYFSTLVAFVVQLFRKQLSQLPYNSVAVSVRMGL